MTEQLVLDINDPVLPERFPVITLCGSTKFMHEFDRVDAELTLQGVIVLKPGVYSHALNLALDEEVKVHILDPLHIQKIDMADEVVVINVDDYIGASTRNEIRHALATGKPVTYVFPHRARQWERKIGRCALCGAIRPFLQTDHRIPKHKGGTNDVSNLQYICANCHEDKTRAELQARVSPNKGRKASAETRKKQSDAHRGQPSGTHGPGPNAQTWETRRRNGQTTGGFNDPLVRAKAWKTRKERYGSSGHKPKDAT